MGLSDILRSLFWPDMPAPASASVAASTSALGSVDWPSAWEDQIKRVVYPYDLIPGPDAEAAFLAAQERGRIEGFSPLVLAPNFEPVPDMSREELIAAAQRVLQAARPASEFFDAKLAEMVGDVELDEENPDPALFDTLKPIEPPSRAGGMHTQHTHQFDPATRTFASHPQVALVRIPTAHSWEIPAYMMFGGWNACPKPAQLVSIAKHWHERYGADICGIGRETLELRVARRPGTHEEAVALLREIYLCGVEMEAGREEFEEYAAELRVLDYWFFWWD